MRPGSTRAGWLISVDPRIVDGLIAVSLAGAGCLVGSQYHPEGWPPFDVLAYVLTCLVSLPLAVRRRYPVSTLVASGTALTAYLSAGYQPSVSFWGPVIALVSAAAYRPRTTTLACTLLTGAVIFYSGVKAHLPPVVSIAQSLLVPGLAAVFGAGWRRLAERNSLLATLSAQLHAEQQGRARRAVMEERVRIARELHDVVAHHMSVISVQAGLARYVLASDPDTSRTALETIFDTSREALAEMRRMLALLRVGPTGTGADGRDGGGEGPTEDGRNPAPGLDRLDVLTDRVRAAGVPVRVVVTGAHRPLTSGADLCVYRVIQEGLTNVLTHAGPARATVALEYHRDGFTARITDDGSRPPGSERTPGGRTGHGLTGMRERARLYGGTLAAGHRPEGGFEVVLTLPASVMASIAGDRAASGNRTTGGGGTA